MSNPVGTTTLCQAAKLDFQQQLKEAREAAFRDAEAFDGIIHVIERMGCLLHGSAGDLGKYQTHIGNVAQASELAYYVPEVWGELHTPFPRLYTIVREGRNDALHQGASARHLTSHAVELALMLEDALRMNKEKPKVRDFMVRHPVCAEMWQPISDVRQQMLVNSFSFLPVKSGDVWYLLSDLDVAKYLLDANDRRVRLAKRLSETGLVQRSANLVSSEMSISEAITKCTDIPLLVHRPDPPNDVIGILTAFDLL